MTNDDEGAADLRADWFVVWEREEQDRHNVRMAEIALERRRWRPRTT